MLKNLNIDKSILSQWLNADFMESGKVNPTLAVTPQGGIISVPPHSPTLMNMILNQLQGTIERASGVKRGKHYEIRSNVKRVSVIRYADDFVVTAHSQAFLVDTILLCINEFMSQRGLALSQKKRMLDIYQKVLIFLVKTSENIMANYWSSSVVKAYYT